MIFDVTSRLYRLVGQRATSSSAAADRFASIELQRLAGCEIGDGRDKYGHLFIGSRAEIVALRESIIDCLPSLLGLQDLTAWRRQRIRLSMEFGEFFGSKDRRDEDFGGATGSCAGWPALIWAAPIYVSTQYTSMQRWRLPPSDKVLTPIRRLPFTARSIRLRFTEERRAPTLSIHPQQLRPHYPSGVHSQPKWVKVVRGRYGVRENRQPFSVYEQNLGLANSDEDEWIDRALFPSHDGLVFRTDTGRTKYIDFSVLMLVRLVPGQCILCTRVEQYLLSLRRDSGEIVDINAYGREFEAFLGQYVGMQQLVEAYVQ